MHGEEGVGIGDGGDHDVQQPDEENQLWSHPATFKSSTFMSPGCNHILTPALTVLAWECVSLVPFLDR